MANRPVYSTLNHAPWFTSEDVEFVWNPGLAPSQKKKNSKAIEKAYLEKHPDSSILEVSTKSDKDEGLALSPFNLSLTLPDLKKAFPVENIYQASKVFEQGGPFVDLLGTSPLDAKRDERKDTSGKLTHFQMNGINYPANPEILFYTWLYIQALLENEQAAKNLLKYDAFSDVEYSPSSSTKNNQARACAIYKSLIENGKEKDLRDFESFAALFRHPGTEQKQPGAIRPEPQGQQAEKKPEKPLRRKTFKPGQWISHPNIGKGQIISKGANGYLVNFPVFGPKTISSDFVEYHCSKTTAG